MSKPQAWSMRGPLRDGSATVKPPALRCHGNESGLTGRQPEELSKILGIPSGAFAAPLEAPLIAGLPHEVESEVAHDRHVLGSMFWAPCPLRRREWSSPKSTSSTQCRLVSMRQCARTA